MSQPKTELAVSVESMKAALDSGSPLAEPGLHPDVAERLIELAKRCSNDRAFKIVVHNHSGDDSNAISLPQAIQSHFQRDVEVRSQRIRENFRYARRATLAGLGVVAVFLGIASELPEEGGRFITALHESLYIFAWVTMWRPAELWLFEHLPERRVRSLSRRLAEAEVSVQ